MDNEDFRDKVERELKSLDRGKQICFTWFCAVRVLPFLGINGHFDFWQDKNKQRHIYAIFHALDVSAASAALPAFTASAAAAALAAFTASASTADNAAAEDAYAVYAAAASAAYAASAADDAADDASSVAAVYAASRAVRAASYYKMDLEPIILYDLNRIKTSTENDKHHRTDWYGEIWDHFQTALEKEGCVYWGRLYQRIFDNGFVVDIPELERRLSVPKEIKEEGAASVANYLEALEKGATQLNEARVIILGEKGAGKTCIARRLVNPKAEMTTSNDSTAGVDTSLWNPEKSDINVRIWDFAGHTVTHAVHQFFLSERCLYLLVYDGRTEDRNRLTYWLDHMKNYGGESSAIILVNKRDNHCVDIPVNSLKEKYPIAGIYTFSIQDDARALLAFREEVAEYIKQHPSWEKEQIPTDYFHVKAALEERFDKDKADSNQEHITRDEFNNIAEQCGVDREDTEKLLNNLHALGVSLWYQDMDHCNTLVLNPEWISHGVYQIINWANEEKKYALSIKDFATVFKDNRGRYPKDKDAFLFELMMHFELAYPIKDEKEIIIPHLLKEDRPEKLPEFPIGDALMLRYYSEQPLPPHTISRFIVRHNKEIKKKRKDYQVWRYGVVLEKEKTIALVREDDRTISVSVRGQEKTSYISALRETLNNIFDSYKSDKPELQYRVERHGQIPDDVEERYPLWVVDRKVTNLHKRDKPLYDDITDQNIPMAPTVNNFNINNSNAIFGGHGHTINDFDFQNCNITLQGSLNELAQLFTENGNNEEAKKLAGIANALEQAKNCRNQEEVKKSGVMNRVRRWLDDVNDTSSTLYNIVRNVENGIAVAQDIGEYYNELAQYVGLPQIPKPFL